MVNPAFTDFRQPIKPGQRKYRTVYRNGRKAATDGSSRDACPYVDLRLERKGRGVGPTHGTVFRDLWLKGWDDVTIGLKKRATMNRTAVRKLLRKT